MSALRRHRRALLAAARLGAIYTAGVLAILLPLLIASPSAAVRLEVLSQFSAISAILFAVAFLVLAVARRFGFAILWLLVLVVWGSEARVAVSSDGEFGSPLEEFGSAFFGWTLLAAPLLAMQVLGIPPSAAPRSRWRRVAARAGAALWAVAAVAGFIGPYNSYVPFGLGPTSRSLLSLVWIPGPLVVTALALAGLRRLKPQPDSSETP